MKEFRDGCDIFIKGKFLRFTKNKQVTTDPTEFEMINKKVDKVRSRHCIAGGKELSLTDFVYIPMGEDDIILVYYLTASGLNDALWTPTFWMPLLENILDVATNSSWFRDMDAAEMFHNYKMSEILQPYAGIDVSWAEKGNALHWEIWTRMAMGLVYLPFATTNIFYWAAEVITGDMKRSQNPFF